MTGKLEVRVPTVAELADVLSLRYLVLDAPVGLPCQAALGDADLSEKAIHVTAFLRGKLVCAVRLDPLPEHAYLVRRMATDPEYQRQGIGSKVLKTAEVLAKAKGARRLVLNSRLSAVEFYTKQGFTPNGHVEFINGDQNPQMVKDI